MRELFDAPSQDEIFYAKALRVLSRPNRVIRTIGLVMNIAYWVFILTCLGFVTEQVLDRSRPSTIISMTAEPRLVVAGQPVRVHTVVDRHRRCDYAIEWSIVDSLHEVHHYGPKEMRAPGAPGPDDYVLGYDTSQNLPAGPASLLISLRGVCPGNYLEKWWPLVLDMPEVGFDVVSGPHDEATSPHG